MALLLPKDIWKYIITPYLSMLDNTSLRATSNIFRNIIRDNVSFVRNKTTNKVLCWAAEKGKIDIVQLILNNNYDLSINRSLNLAAARGHTNIVQLLIDYGADDIYWALRWARDNGHTDTVQLLNNYRYLRENILLFFIRRIWLRRRLMFSKSYQLSNFPIEVTFLTSVLKSVFQKIKKYMGHYR